MTTSRGSSLIEGYELDHGLVDEFLDPAVGYRDHWRPLGEAFDALGPRELRNRQQDVRRLLAADGATYRILDTNRLQPWKLDAVPLLVASAEWAQIESGVIQRAVLLDLVLRDLYGERKLLQRGVIPAEVVLPHPGFVPACDGIRLPDGSQLFTYAADIGRDPSGGFRVIADYAQAPSGAGYALENRVVLSRVFPSLYRDAQVHRVAPFFRSLRAGLESLGEGHSETPRIVVLTPGSQSETAFEHAFLASYLGYPLVEGADLVVTDGAVHLRTLGGLERVDVILRRVDAAYSDPLELRPESQLGVPGLVEACRRGSVVVANPIGSGAIENPALNAFLPAAAEALLGQELRLPGVRTWWCGDPDSLRYVLDHLDELVCKSLTHAGPARTRIASNLSAAERRILRAQIETRPHEWTATETVRLSTAPTLTSAGLRPRRTLLRTYAAAHEGSFTVMPGGLTRVAPDERSTVISNQTGALAKDTWVLSSEPERTSAPWLGNDPVVVPTDPFGGMSERAAENLFWVGRYAERAESVVRLLRAVHDRRNDQTTRDEAGQRAVEALLRSLTVATYTWPGFVGDDAAERLRNPDAELFSLACDARRPGSLAYAVSRLLPAAESVRDQLSIDTWQVTSTLERLLATLSTASPGRQDVVQGTLGEVMQSLLALHGLAGESMVRDVGWHFMEAGRRLERFHHLSVLLRAGLMTEYDPATEGILLESLLVAAESIVTYRRRYRSRAQVKTLLDLLVTDGGNPRSLRYQADRLTEAVAGLPGADPVGTPSELQRRVLRLSTAVRLADTASLAPDQPHRHVGASADGGRAPLVAFLDQLIIDVEQAAQELSSSSFTQARLQRTLTGFGSDDGLLAPAAPVQQLGQQQGPSHTQSQSQSQIQIQSQGPAL
ncbi:MAG: circularly permuted type 2 ATP-grasp protein [Actinomycetota bacterium]